MAHTQIPLRLQADTSSSVAEALGSPSVSEAPIGGARPTNL